MHVRSDKAMSLCSFLLASLSLFSSSQDEKSSLIGAHSYCTQELVSLALTGRARSNVFNGAQDLGGLLLRGIDRRARVGFLSLFEHYEHLSVGSFLKCPQSPVWVVCSESHYSVLFALDPDLVDQPPKGGVFDLYYYDELANQKEEIRLTVDLTQSTPAPRDGDLEPPINGTHSSKSGSGRRGGSCRAACAHTFSRSSLLLLYFRQSVFAPSGASMHASTGTVLSPFSNSARSPLDRQLNARPYT